MSAAATTHDHASRRLADDHRNRIWRNRHQRDFSQHRYRGGDDDHNPDPDFEFGNWRQSDFEAQRLVANPCR
jgi:hypothetical protein